MGAYASVAQLDRASDSDSEGRGFESRQMHHEIAPLESFQAAFCFTLLILILNQPIDKLSAIISSFCVKLPCQACSPPVGGGVGIMPTEGLTDRPACLRSLSKVNGVT